MWPDQGRRSKSGQCQEAPLPPAPQQPGKAAKALLVPVGPMGSQRLKNSSADAKAYRKTKAGSQSSKPTATKGENGVASPAKKKTGNKVLKEATTQGGREGLKAKAAAAPKDSGSKTVPVPLARKDRGPKGPRRPGIPTKSLSSKGTSTKAEPRARGRMERL